MKRKLSRTATYRPRAIIYWQVHLLSSLLLTRSSTQAEDVCFLCHLSQSLSQEIRPKSGPTHLSDTVYIVHTILCLGIPNPAYANFQSEEDFLLPGGEKPLKDLNLGCHKFYFACIVRCIGLCHYYQGRLQSWFSSAWPWLEAIYWQ